MNDITLPPDECAIVSSDGMTRLEMLVPVGDGSGLLPPIARYLFACYMRFHNDPEFVAEQLQWFDQNA